MTKKEQQAAAREAEIAQLATQVKERAQTKRGGSAMLVPCSDPQKCGMGIYLLKGVAYYRVDLDENYRPIACTCPATRACKHRAAAELAVQPRLAVLLESPIYSFFRNNTLILARLSQFSNSEKKALRQQEERFEKEAADRAAYLALFDPHAALEAFC